MTLKRAPVDQVLEDVSVHFDEEVEPQIVDSQGRPLGAATDSGIRIAGPASFAQASSLGSVFACTTSGRSSSADDDFVSTHPMPLSIELTHVHALDDFDTGSFFPHRDPFFLMQVSGEAQATIGFEAKSAFTCELSDSFRETHRIAIPLGAVGPVPVTMYLEPTLKFEVSASGDVTLSQHHYWGVTLEQNGFAPFEARLSHSADPVDFHASAAIGASLFAGGDLSVMFGAGEGAWALQAGIYGAFGPDFELKAGTDHPGCITATAKLEADLGVRLQVLVKRWSAQLASLTSSPASLGGPWCVGGGPGGSGGSPGGGSPGGGSPGGGTPPPGGGGPTGGEAPLANLAPAWAGYFYESLLPGTSGNTQTGPEAVSSDPPPGTTVLAGGAIAGLPPTPGTFEFHASWNGATEPMHGPFRLTVEEPDVSLPANALAHFGIVGPEDAWFDDLKKSPDGRHVAATLGEPETLVIYDLQNHALTQLTGGSDRSGIGYGGWPANLGWSPDGRYLAFTSTEPLLGPTANGPWYNVYLYDTATHSLSRLTDGSNGDAYNPAWSPDGDLITFNEGGEVVVYEPSTGHRETIPCSAPIFGCRATVAADGFSAEPWSADSEHLTFLELGNGYYEPTSVWVWDRQTDSVRKLSDAIDARLSPDGYRVMVNTQDFGDLELLNVVTGAVERDYGDQTGLYLESSQMVGTSQWSPDGQYVSGWRCAESECGPAVMSVATGHMTQIPHGDGYLAGWKGQAPMWCYYHKTPQNYLEGNDCVTWDPITETSSVTYLDTWSVMELSSAGWWGEFGGTGGHYAVATWNPW